MRAITYSTYGPPDVLQLTEVSRPVPKDDEVLVRVRAAEATKSDCEMRSFKYSVKWFWLPLRIALSVRKPRRQILGGYFSGEIESLWKDVTTFSVGDQVFGTAELRPGAYGEYVALPARYTIVAKPNNISFAEAAAVPLGGLNALHFMRRAKIRAGEQVLINGAGGSVGAHAVQIAKSMGAEVTAVDSTTKEGMLRRIGADHFVDYTKEDFAGRGQTYDVIFDHGSRELLYRLYRGSQSQRALSLRQSPPVGHAALSAHNPVHEQDSHVRVRVRSRDERRERSCWRSKR